MKRTILLVVGVIGLLLVSCSSPTQTPNAPSSTRVPTQSSSVTALPRPTSAAPTAETVPAETSGLWYRLIPVELRKVGTGGGWTEYEFSVAIENTGTTPQEGEVIGGNFLGMVNFGYGEVETQEGYTYPVTAFGGEPLNMRNPEMIIWSDRIPPGFRFAGYGGTGDHRNFTFGFRAAETSHPTRLMLSNYGTVDLITQDVTFPTDRPPSEFLNFPATVEIPGKARLTFERMNVAFSQESLSYGRIDRGAKIYVYGLELEVTATNLNVGYQTSVYLECGWFNGMGDIGGFRGAISIGPGQTVTAPYGSGFTVYQRDDLAQQVENVFNNMKVYCSGDTDVILNVPSEKLTAEALQSSNMTVVFNVTVPDNTPADRSVYLEGTFNLIDKKLPEWDASGILLTQLDDTHWTYTLTSAIPVTLDYAYTLGSFDSEEADYNCYEITSRRLYLDHGTPRMNDDNVLYVDDVVPNWENVEPCSGMSADEPRTVVVKFYVTVPDYTPADSILYIAGTLDELDSNLPWWDPAGVMMTRVSDTQWMVTLGTGKESTYIEYKYTLGSWHHVEKDSACGEISNRQLTLTYSEGGLQTVNDTVPHWANSKQFGGPCSD